MEKIITVTKTVSDKLPPDTAVFSLTTAVTAKKYGDAVRESETRASQLVATLAAAGFDGLRAHGINVSPMRENGKQTGYRAVRSFSLKFAYDGARIAAATEALTSVDCEWRLSFALENPDCKTELINRAVKESKAEAEIIAAAAGEKLGGLCEAEYGSSDCGCSPVMLRAAYCADGANNVEPESITLTETVSCGWEIKNGL